MNKILIATALALVASAPLAFARTTTPPASDLTTAHYTSESAFLIAEQKAESLCRWDKHPNDGGDFGTKTASKS